MQRRIYLRNVIYADLKNQVTAWLRLVLLACCWLCPNFCSRWAQSLEELNRNLPRQRHNLENQLTKSVFVVQGTFKRHDTWFILPHKEIWTTEVGTVTAQCLSPPSICSKPLWLHVCAISCCWGLISLPKNTSTESLLLVSVHIFSHLF